MTVTAYLALGSNLGDRADQLKQAIRKLHARPGICIKRVSAIYETDPVGFVEQDAFLNMVIAAETSLSAEQLLQAALSIEQELGRVRTVRWGPRTLDIDLLLYGDSCIEQEHLRIPHPEMTKRAFVLIPLQDVWSGETLPVYNHSISHYLSDLPQDQKGVRKWGTIDWETESVPSES
ncbi:2-amino-4-hydroxy-6-hydroxymethyldihydropteridine diphosphokinase [Brevibacillus sp. TJ4]|uniref:2-amino-4-hydroxy-6- hydroxymethyldihydropteridine diphosphokinase n=1 Tax=Brevibacillus sp. TJ4 TaxID=3234853 RepID=UPI0037D5F352